MQTKFGHRPVHSPTSVTEDARLSSPKVSQHERDAALKNEKIYSVFGQLLVFALYKRYKEEGESFKPKYMRILSAGGSVAPIALLAESGMDVTKAEFWQGGFDVIDGMVKRLENM